MEILVDLDYLETISLNIPNREKIMIGIKYIQKPIRYKGCNSFGHDALKCNIVKLEMIPKNTSRHKHSNTLTNPAGRNNPKEKFVLGVGNKCPVPKSIRIGKGKHMSGQ